MQNSNDNQEFFRVDEEIPGNERESEDGEFYDVGSQDDQDDKSSSSEAHPTNTRNKVGTIDAETRRQVMNPIEFAGESSDNLPMTSFQGILQTPQTVKNTSHVTNGQNNQNLNQSITTTNLHGNIFRGTPSTTGRLSQIKRAKPLGPFHMVAKNYLQRINGISIDDIKHK